MRHDPRLRRATRRTGAPLTKIAAALAILVSLAAGLAISGPASTAQAATAPAPNTDYANYPDGVIVEGCNADGGSILTDVTFTSGAQSNTDLRQLTLNPGDLVTMTWTGFAEGCESQLISFAAKRAQHSTFDATDEQELIPGFAYCGGDTGVSCGSDGSFALSLTIPSRTVACNVQIDAVIGAPLANVGIPPNGTFYGDDLREQFNGHAGPNMLIGASNFGGDASCVAPTPSYYCAVGGIGVHLANAQSYDQIIRIFNGATLLTELTVPAAGSTDFTVPVNAGSTFDVIVRLFDSQLDYTVDEYDNSGNPRNCENPNVVPACVTGAGEQLTLSNTGGEGPVVFTVKVGNGAPVDYPVGSNGTITVPTGIAEDTTQHVLVTATGEAAAVFDADISVNCEKAPPAPPTVSHACGTPGSVGEVLTLTNPQDGAAVVLTVTIGGVSQDVSLAVGETKQLPLGIAEDSSAHVTVQIKDGEGAIFDETIAVDCVPPSLGFSAVAACRQDAPWVDYTAVPSGESSTTITFHWVDANGVERLTLPGLPLSGSVLFPGAEVDATGKGTEWPGWIKNADGSWTQGEDGFLWARQPGVKVFATGSPASDPVVVSYPPSDPTCNPNPPAQVEGEQIVPPTAVQSAALPRTGTDIVPIVLFAGFLLALGGGLLVVSNASSLKLAVIERRKNK